jgi:polyhydroxyalkanoate synthase subunit PhaE
MSAEQPDKTVPEFPLADWMKRSQEFWTTWMRMAPAPREAPESGHEPPGKPRPEETRGRLQESWETAFRMWQSLSTAATDPANADAAIKGLGTLPDFYLKLAQAGWLAVMKAQERMVEKAGKIGQKTEAYNFDAVDQNLIKAWKEIYEEEIRQFYQIPQLGLTRYYQERLNDCLDQMNLFQASFSEFLYVLSVPVEKTSKVFREKLEEMQREGRVPEKSKDYYQLWLRILEGHYMTLFQSPEYLESLRSMLGQLDSFLIAKNSVLQDVLQFLPVPTNKEMDELIKDLHVFKRRVRELERRLKALEKGNAPATG